MDLTNTKTVKKILEEFDTRPIKNLGQNFLINEGYLKKITSLIKKNETIIEIGPGIGTLTKEISKISKKIIAIEKDKKMVEIMKETLKDYDNIEIIHKDALKEIENISLINYTVVSNLPYYIATAIIRRFLELKNKPQEMILTIQKELAQRICSNPPNMSILSVSVQFYGKPKIISSIPKNCFWPQPRVDSSIIKVTPYNNQYSNSFSNLFFKVVKSGFSKPRAQLLNNLSKKLKLEKEEIKNLLISININPKQRAETLTIEDWINLAKKLK